MVHHGLQPVLLLPQLGLQLGHDLDLHPGVGRGGVVQRVRPLQVWLEVGGGI